MKELKLRSENVLLFSIIIIIALLFVYAFIRIAIDKHEDFKNLWLLLLFGIVILMILIPFFLSISYFYVGLKRKVFIDETNRHVIIKENGKELVISHKDIVESFYVCVDRLTTSHYYFPCFEYILLILKERKRIYITNLIYEPELIIKLLGLKVNVVHMNLPFLDKSLGSIILTSKEFENKVHEFENNFKEFSDSKLENIIHQKNVYTEYAIEAAKNILNKRKK